MKRNTMFAAAKAVLVGVIISGMATACQNGDSPVGNLLQQDAGTSMVAGATAQQAKNGATTQSDEERKAEQARKIAEFLAKPEVKEMSAGLEEIAQAVAVAVEDKALTQRIYEKCLEKFDGETNTLWQHLEADGKLKGNGGWNKRIDAELSKGRKNAVVKGIGNIDAAIKKFEKTVGAPMHLFWMYPSKWDKKTTPLVAFLPFDVNPKMRTSIPAFDSKGNRFELGNDGALAKQRPVLVFTVNERTLPNGNFKESLTIGESHEMVSKTNNNFIASRKLPNTKLPDQIHSGTTLGWIRVFSYGVSAQWTDPEYEGSPEFFYWFTTDGWLVSDYQYLGTARGGFVGRNHEIKAPGNSNKSYVKYWEADVFFLFDDFIDQHTLDNFSPVQNGYTTHTGMQGCTSLTNNVFSYYVYITK